MQMPAVPATPPPQPRALPASRGSDWLAESFALFQKQPGVWIGILLIWMLMSGVISAVGLGIVGPFLSPIFTAGLMLGCASLERGEGLRVEHLFAGFSSGRVGPLLMLTVWTFVLGLALAVVLVLMALPVFGALKSDPTPMGLLNAMGFTGIFLFVVVAATGGVLIAMASWFAPALIVFRGVSAVDALKLSFRGCLTSWLALSVYGLLVLLMLIVAAIPLLLGLLIAIPVLLASVYTSYRDIFPE